MSSGLCTRGARGATGPPGAWTIGRAARSGGAALSLALAIACARAGPRGQSEPAPVPREAASAAPERPSANEGPAAIIAFPQPWDGYVALRNTQTAQDVHEPVRQGRATVRQSGMCVTAYSVQKTDPRGGEWEARGSLPPGPVPELLLGRTLTLACGPPFTASVRPETSAGRESLSLLVCGAAGEPVAFYRSGARAPEPGFHILNQDGQVVFSGNFRYG